MFLQNVLVSKIFNEVTWAVPGSCATLHFFLSPELSLDNISVTVITFLTASGQCSGTFYNEKMP